MPDNFYVNTTFNVEAQLRDPKADADLHSLTVTWSLQTLADVELTAASGTATYLGTIGINGKTYYRFDCEVPKAKAALMTAGLEYQLSVSEATTGANAKPKAEAIVYRGR